MALGITGKHREALPGFHPVLKLLRGRRIQLVMPLARGIDAQLAVDALQGLALELGGFALVDVAHRQLPGCRHDDVLTDLA